VTTFWFSAKSIDLPAVPVAPSCATVDPTAWLAGDFRTVRLLDTVQALRVHTNGKAFPAREASMANGRWILIGDVIMTSGQIADSRSLPGKDVSSMIAFAHVSEATLERGVVINIGLASTKFAGRGGGFQAEYVRGPVIRFDLLKSSMWHGREGMA
jgi:hypothetical protein